MRNTATKPVSIHSGLLPANSFLSGAFVLSVSEGSAEPVGTPAIDVLVANVLAQRFPKVEVFSEEAMADVAAAIAIPVLRGDEVTSVVVLMATRKLPSEVDVPEPVGVFEVWSPIPPYAEVCLDSGYYGKMERFANVSSFVRFECGTGLPGQVWEKAMGVIHQDLSNHPGFLRAAGASADLLQTAMGIPVFGSDFIASVLLITSDRTPLVRGVEIWNSSGKEDFEWLGGVYTGDESAAASNKGRKLRRDEGWAALISESNGAVSSQDPDVIGVNASGEGVEQAIQFGIAIPHFGDDVADSFVTLLF
ncbi:MAG: GAF domain-containing protein [Planctomycetota bacterium]